MSSIFPLVKKFQDVKTSHRTAFLTEETVIHGKCFRSGTVFSVVGWKEVKGKPFIILNKGSWEGLLSHEDFLSKLEKLNDK